MPTPTAAPAHRRSSRRIIVIAGDSRSHRQDKIEEVLTSRGLDGEFWVWDRLAPLPAPEELRMPRRALLGIQAVGTRLALAYAAWMAAVFWATLRSRTCGPFYCIGFIAAFPVAVASLLRRRVFVFDNNDNFSLSHRWPRVVGMLLHRLEEFTAGRAVLHVVPGSERWPRKDPNLRIIRNAPTQTAIATAKRLAASRGYSRPDVLTVYVNGWLPSTRGVPTFLRAMQILAKTPIQMIVAGRVGCPEGEELIRLPNVEFLGDIPQTEALALYYRSHIALTYYDPDIAINRLAESNKWADCVLTGVPFVVNSEVETTGPFIAAGCALQLPYSDATGLAQLLEDLNREQSMLQKIASRLPLVHLTPWDEAMADVVDELFQRDQADLLGGRAQSSASDPPLV
jgi:glycosyltransferase involved in cell wall biosynthesis